MSYRIKPARGLRRLTAQEQKIVARRLQQMMQNPYHPSLRTKKVQGLHDVFECSVNMDIRILWQYQEGDVIVLEIGHHSLLERQ